MAKADENRCVRTYHATVAILILIAGGALLGFGVYLSATDNEGPLALEYSGESWFNAVLNANIGAMIIGGFLMLTAVVSLVALSRQCIGNAFRIIYIIMAGVILAALLLTTIVSVIFLRNESSEEVRTIVRDAWKRTIANEPKTVCEIEKSFECRGFSDGQCSMCVTGVEPACKPVAEFCAECPDSKNFDPKVGCYERIKDEFRSFFLPIAIVFGILSAVVLVDIIATCCL